jgi:hypothetical protein
MEVSICINYTGNTELGPNMVAYSNTTNYTTPIGSPIPLIDLVPPNCPYILTGVPEGTTRIRLVDPTSGCCVELLVGAFNICEVCGGLGFSDTTNPNLGRLSLGFLTGECDTNISNFYLEWYGPGTGSTQLQFTSGLGTNYITPNIQHPLTGTTSPLLFAGEYRPIIKEIEIDNVIYNNTYGAIGDCFQNNPFIVEPYTVTNGSGIDYEHELIVNTTSAGNPLNFGTIELSATTNYVPYRFNPGSDAEMLVIYYSGSNYSEFGNKILIQLENIVIGETSLVEQNSFKPTGYPKYIDEDGFFTRVLCLTGLTRSEGDLLLFYVIPAESSNTTFFQFYFDQKENFNCDTCITTSPQYLLSASSFSATTGICGNITLTFSVSGCSTGVDDNKDLYKYIFKNSSAASTGFSGYGSNGLIQRTIQLGDNKVYEAAFNQPTNVSCTNMRDYFPGNFSQPLSFPYGGCVENSNFIEFLAQVRTENTIGLAGLEAYFDLQEQTYNNILSQYPNYQDPTHTDYLTALYWYIPPIWGTGGGNQPNFNCSSCGPGSSSPGFNERVGLLGGSEVTFINETYTIVGSSTVEMKKRGMRVKLRMFRNANDLNAWKSNALSTYSCSTVSVIGNQLGTFLSGSAVDNFVINEFIPLTANRPAIVPPAGSGLDYASFNFFPQTLGASCTGTIMPDVMFKAAPYILNQLPYIDLQLTGVTSDDINLYQYQVKTYPSSGTTAPFHQPQFLIPSLSATTCISLTGLTYNPYSGDSGEFRGSYWRNLYTYVIGLTDPNLDIYNIYTLPRQTNGTVSQTPILIGTGTGSTVTVLDPTYFTP